MNETFSFETQSFEPGGIRLGVVRGISYWQCDNEPSNTDLLWAGTAAEYAEQLQTMYGAVKEADPAAAVVLGGCGYDVFSSEPGSAQRQFFDHVTKAGRDAFDLFSVHLYGDLDRIPRIHRHRPAVHAGPRVPQARRGGRARWPAAVRVSRGHGGDAGDLRRRLRRGRRGRVTEHRRAGRTGRAGHSRTPGDEGPVRPDGQPAAPAADVHGGLPGGAGRQAGPHQLPSGGHAHRAGPGRGRAPDRVLDSPTPRRYAAAWDGSRRT